MEKIKNLIKIIQVLKAKKRFFYKQNKMTQIKFYFKIGEVFSLLVVVIKIITIYNSLKIQIMLFRKCMQENVKNQQIKQHIFLMIFHFGLC